VPRPGATSHRAYDPTPILVFARAKGLDDEDADEIYRQVAP
jgi:hypothetical protein